MQTCRARLVKTQRRQASGLPPRPAKSSHTCLLEITSRTCSCAVILAPPLPSHKRLRRPGFHKHHPRQSPAQLHVPGWRCQRRAWLGPFTEPGNRNERLSNSQALKRDLCGELGGGEERSPLCGWGGTKGHCGRRTAARPVPNGSLLPRQRERRMMSQASAIEAVTDQCRAAAADVKTGRGTLAFLEVPRWQLCWEAEVPKRLRFRSDWERHKLGTEPPRTEAAYLRALTTKKRGALLFSF